MVDKAEATEPSTVVFRLKFATDAGIGRTLANHYLSSFSAQRKHPNSEAFGATSANPNLPDLGFSDESGNSHGMVVRERRFARWT